MTSQAGTSNTISYERGVLTTSDGTRLVADIYRPSGVGRVPALLMRTPYGRRKAESMLYAHPSWYARHGYGVVVQDLRGRYESEGTFVPWDDETEDGLQTLEWVAGQAWCDGRVGMYGFSYPGLVQLMLAVKGHPALRAIAPVVAPVALADGLLFEAGAFALGFALGWALDLALDASRRSAPHHLPWLYRAAEHRRDEYAKRPLIAHPLADAEGPAPYYRDWIDQAGNEAHWRERSIVAALGDSTAPSLTVGGWHDPFIGGTLAAHVKSSATARRLVVGPWSHYPAASSPSPKAPDNPARIDVDQLAWFDAHLRDAAGEAGPGVDIHWCGASGWETLPEWPPPTRLLRLHLRSGGRANGVGGDGLLRGECPGPSEPPDVFVYDPAWPVNVPDANDPSYPMLTPLGPADQVSVEASHGVLVYTAEPLDETLVVAGRPRVHLETVTDAVDTDWVATLCDVDAVDGRSVNVARGIVRARSVSGGRAVAGQQLTHEIMLPPIGHVFARGHRIRLQVTSSAFPTWEPNPNTGHPLGVDGFDELVVATQTLIHEAGLASWLELPCRI